VHYVYVIQSISIPKQMYVGCTEDLNERLATHNKGGSSHTAKYRPWKMILFIGFEHKEKAIDFEQYLKSGVGRTFAKKRFW
jgi:putative endonuclease